MTAANRNSIAEQSQRIEDEVEDDYEDEELDDDDDESTEELDTSSRLNQPHSYNRTLRELYGNTR